MNLACLRETVLLLKMNIARLRETIQTKGFNLLLEEFLAAVGSMTQASLLEFIFLSLLLA